MTQPANQKGFTLIELLLVILLMGVIGTMVTKIYIQGITSVQSTQNAADALWQGRLAIERMAREIRMVRSAVDINTSTSGEFSFTDISGNAIDYTLSGTSLMRNSEVLADGIHTLSFSYFDKNGASTGSSTNFAYVTIAINVTQANANYTLTTSVYLRDLSS